MRALLVTSEVTLVPRNYDDVVVELARCPQLAGVLVLQNASLRLGGTALGLMAIGAPRVGRQLLRNLLGRSRRRRRSAWAAQGKPVFTLPDINSPEAVELVRDQRIDLLVNARTRFIFKAPILEAAPLGALNVHHGLLPEQRGLMCDLWALYEGQPAGFTLHQMNRRIDDGGLIHREVVSDGHHRDYRAYLQLAARREAVVIPELLARIAADGEVQTTCNPRDPDVPHRTNPTRAEIRMMRRAGMRL